MKNGPCEVGKVVSSQSPELTYRLGAALGSSNCTCSIRLSTEDFTNCSCWICARRPAIGRVIVHSLNAPAAEAMELALRDAGYDATRIPYLQLVACVPLGPG